MKVIKIQRQTDGMKQWEPVEPADLELFRHLSGGFISVTHDTLPMVVDVAEMHGVTLVKDDE